MGYFDQVQAKLDLNKTAIDEVWSAFPAMTETKVCNALAAFLFKGDEVYRPLRDCSGGERARIALLKLMLGKYNFLLLDELQIIWTPPRARSLKTRCLITAARCSSFRTTGILSINSQPEFLN
jgi:ABC-type transport system involved in cytochrome c biogenesis ATPase subunit